jgi:hypothetical protein
VAEVFVLLSGVRLKVLDAFGGSKWRR